MAVAAALIALAVSACGIRGPLELPPEAKAKAQADAAKSAQKDASAPAKAPAAHRPFILDGLIQ